jgi:hypothetical protein
VVLLLCNEREAPQVLYKLFDHHHHHLTLQAQRVDLIAVKALRVSFPALEIAAAYAQGGLSLQLHHFWQASSWRAGGLLSLAAPT